MKAAVTLSKHAFPTISLKCIAVIVGILTSKYNYTCQGSSEHFKDNIKRIHTFKNIRESSYSCSQFKTETEKKTYRR